LVLTYQIILTFETYREQMILYTIRRGLLQLLVFDSTGCGRPYTTRASKYNCPRLFSLK